MDYIINSLTSLLLLLQFVQIISKISFLEMVFFLKQNFSQMKKYAGNMCKRSLLQ